LLFRLSDTDYLNYRSWEIAPGTPALEIDRLLETNVRQWLLADAGAKVSTSLATGLFNHLKLNREFRKRRILLFGDGLENHPSTVSFYQLRSDPGFLDRSRWDDIDRSISKFESVPDLRCADVTWYFTPYNWIEYRYVHRYWAHVLSDLAHANKVGVVY
jgi:hypothetical protein